MVTQQLKLSTLELIHFYEAFTIFHLKKVLTLQQAQIKTTTLSTTNFSKELPSAYSCATHKPNWQVTTHCLIQYNANDYLYLIVLISYNGLSQQQVYDMIQQLLGITPECLYLPNVVNNWIRYFTLWVVRAYACWQGCLWEMSSAVLNRYICRPV